jgi:alkylation response protein AidB-like acyl-CoA dehydrogenase
MSTYLNLRKVSIYGGTAEIQKNMIAASMLAI